MKAIMARRKSTQYSDVEFLRLNNDDHWSVVSDWIIVIKPSGTKSATRIPSVYQYLYELNNPPEVIAQPHTPDVERNVA